ncbi:hypothetical protein Q1695_003932 [Nippostrongylus brasiliensis]|nr:hypothetical protein Q1695_003932 [Nippostrongylus brasiliensis]
MLRYSMLLVAFLFALVHSKDTSRSKRQMQAYYLCGGSTNGYVSTGGCGSSLFGGCGSNCGGSNTIVLPNSFYSPSLNCQSSCNNVNCNQFNGQYVNGQYVATVIGSGQYSSCGSSCCGGFNSFNSWPLMGNSMVYSGNDYYNPYTTNMNGVIGTGINNGYNPYAISTNPLTQVGPGPVVISNNIRRSQVTSAFTGTLSNGVSVLLCGGNEPAGGSCAGSGQCPSGHLCMAGNVCCRCPVGASSGTCPSGTDSECPAGYGCSATLNCCPTQVLPSQGLTACVNGACSDGFVCGKGALCYPVG